MAALRVEITTGIVTSEDGVIRLLLDCWKAEFTFSYFVISEWTINGQPIPALMTPEGPFNEFAPFTMRFGGLDLNGKPVNLNTELILNNPVSPSRPIQYVLTRTYYDPVLNDPQTQR